MIVVLTTHASTTVGTLEIVGAHFNDFASRDREGHTKSISDSNLL